MYLPCCRLWCQQSHSRGTDTLAASVSAEFTALHCPPAHEGLHLPNSLSRRPLWLPPPPSPRPPPASPRATVLSQASCNKQRLPNASAPRAACQAGQCPPPLVGSRGYQSQKGLLPSSKSTPHLTGAAVGHSHLDDRKREVKAKGSLSPRLGAQSPGFWLDRIPGTVPALSSSAHASCPFPDSIPFTDNAVTGPRSYFHTAGNWASGGRGQGA